MFAASSANIESRYLADAHELGTLLAQGGWRCVNGGGAVGLMGAVTDGTLDAGGEVTGVIPKFMVDNGWLYDRLEDVIVTADMHQRKQMMSDMADAVIAPPVAWARSRNCSRRSPGASWDWSRCLSSS